MSNFDPGLRGYGQRLQISAGYSIGTFAEVLEVMALAIAAGMLAYHWFPNARGLDEGAVAFATAWGVGAAFGLLYIAWRVLCRLAFRRALVVPIPRDPNVDWYVTMRAFGIAGAGVVMGAASLYHGLGGDPKLRIGSGAPFTDAVLGCLAIGFLYLGLGKLIGRVLRE